tara:strand:+ start:532 stop:849 length:318 start_codon:yes stop_codon:yes gene_type:complete
MGQAYTIDLIDQHARKMHLGSVTPSSVECTKNRHTPLQMRGELKCTPEDKKVYLQTASTHGDAMRLSFSNDSGTFLGKFRLSFFDPQSQQAIFNSIGDVEMTPGS